MARDDEQSKDAARPRVYKASEVHKRRAEKPADKLAEEPSEQQGGDSIDGGTAAEPAKDDHVAEARADETQPIAKPAVDEPHAVEAGDAGEPEPSDKPSSDATSGKPKRRSVRELVEADKSDKSDKSGDRGGRARRKKPGIALQVLGILAAAIVAVLLMFIGYFAANRWFVYDDRTSIQGTWFIDGTSVPITFTEDAIILDAQTEYEYTVDTTAKTITYRFGELEGHGRYWFSSDRHYLVITDGGDYTMWSTLAEDLSRFTGDLIADLFGDGAPLPSGGTSTVLSTTPTINLDSTPSTTTAEALSEE